MEKHPLIRTIYLYLFTLIGLILVVIGSVKFIDMGLKTFVFTRADEPQKIQQRSFGFSSFPIPAAKIEQAQNSADFSEEEKNLLKQWAEDYKKWQEESQKIDYIVSERQREASNNLAMILVGLPLYLYHWSLIKRETKKNTA